ncbi:MAG TPA: hypothetical protein VGF67_18730 [Ktedonobacteraceae bacterium]
MLKNTATKRVVEVLRRMAQGSLEQAQDVLRSPLGGKEWKTAFIERFNGTMRERLASLTRRGRHAARRLSRLEAGMWLVGWTYNGCGPPHEVRRRLARSHGLRGDVAIRPAMASGLTDQVWSVRERLCSRVAPPAWIAPKRRGRKPGAAKPSPKPSGKRSRPLLRLRKGVFSPSTSSGDTTATMASEKKPLQCSL